MTQPRPLTNFRVTPFCAALTLLLATAPAGAGTSPAPTPAPTRVQIETIAKEAHEAPREAATEARAQALQAAEMAEMTHVYAQVDIDELMFEPSLAFVASEFGSAREIVKNAPYSAEAINETIQVLPDGNRIVKRRTTLLARDGYGRTRQEKKSDRGSSSVYIFDPIDGKSYALNTDRKVAVRIPRVPVPPVPPTPPVPPDAVAPPAPPGQPGQPGFDPRVEVQPGRVIIRKGAEGRDGEDVRVEVVRIGRGGDTHIGFAPQAPLPPLTLPTLPRGKGETKRLGSKEFDAIKADGTQTTYTIPAGEIGNEKPIVITSERWFSPEYNIVVYAKQSDPRTGDTIYRLANFKRGEPSAELFKVPTDYKAKGDSRR
jgi:hypothetical protein